MKKEVPSAEQFAEELAVVMLHHEWSQKKIAEILDVRPSYLSDVKNGAKPVTPALYKKWRKEFSVALTGERVVDIDLDILKRDYMERSSQIAGTLIVITEALAELTAQVKKLQNKKSTSTKEEELAILTSRAREVAGQQLRGWSPLLSV